MATKIYLGNPPENIVKWIKENYKPPFKLTDPLCFTAEEAGSTVKMNKHYSAPTVYLETSTTGEDGSWTDFIVHTSSTSTDGTTITLENVGDKVYFRAKQDNERFGARINYIDHYNYFEMTGKIAASGNINTLLKADGSVLDLTADDIDRSYCYYYMFNDCSALTQAPTLPATTLADNCYSQMFYNCSSLTQAPELPATTLTDWCYEYMFGKCRSLTQAPELPATSLARYCYYGMFSNCYSLTEAPELPATELAEDCYYNMFQCCKSPFTFSDKTFDEVANLIQEYYLTGEEQWDVSPIEIICTDKTMLATFDENEWSWTLTEK